MRNLPFWRAVFQSGNIECHGLGFFLAQRELAAFLAACLRWAAVIVSSRLLPPIFPPFLPISAMTFDTISWAALGSSDVASETTAAAIWLGSFILLLIRFGMSLSCTSNPLVARPPPGVKLRHYLS